MRSLQGFKDAIALMGSTIQTQDNLATGDPIFLVQQRERIFGIDTDYTEEIAWVDTDDGFEETGDEPNGWRRTGCIDRWVYVQPFFTNDAAVAYIASNGHNLTDPRVYVASAYRNPNGRRRGR